MTWRSCSIETLSNRTVEKLKVAKDTVFWDHGSLQASG